MTVIVPGHNQLDRQQLRLQPRDYALDPHLFGLDPTIGFHLPPGGTIPALRAARVQHVLVVLWRRHDGRSGAEIGRHVGCSRQTVSRTFLGQRWAGQLLQSALLESLLRRLPPG